jgi:hypothetical protein
VVVGAMGGDGEVVVRGRERWSHEVTVLRNIYGTVTQVVPALRSGDESETAAIYISLFIKLSLSVCPKLFKLRF